MIYATDPSCKKYLETLPQQALDSLNGANDDTNDWSLRQVAASGSTQMGRNGVRDKWAVPFTREWHALKLGPMATDSEIPSPSEFDVFMCFIRQEKKELRAVLTGEHQVRTGRGGGSVSMEGR